MLNQPPGTPGVAPAPDGVEDTTSTPSDDAVATEGRTVAEVEAEWRNRVSAKDRGHAAAERTLREENEALKRQLQGRPAAPGSGTPEGGDPEKDQLRTELETERRLRVAAERRAKYPNLVEAGVSDDLFAASDEASLAKLNAQLDTSGGRIAPTSPRKTPAVAPKPMEDMSKAELEAQLQRAVAAGGHLPKDS